jgi:polyhydroxyalkanoate synthesis regulator phasin
MATADELTRVLDAFYERSIRPEFARLALETARRLQDVTERIEAVRQGLETFRIETNDRLADLYGKFKGLEDEYHLIVGAIRHFEEEGSPAQRAEVKMLHGRMDRVERRLGELEAKISRAPDR